MLTKWRNYWKILKESFRNKDWSEMRNFGRENREVSREILKWVLDRTGSSNIASSKSQQMQVSRGIETPVEKWSSIAEVSRRYRGTLIRTKNRSSINPPGVEKLSRMQTHSQSIHQVLRSCWDCDKKKVKKLDRQQGIEEVSRRCRASF